jgi:hypothetical protein
MLQLFSHSLLRLHIQQRNLLEAGMKIKRESIIFMTAPFPPESLVSLTQAYSALHRSRRCYQIKPSESGSEANRLAQSKDPGTIAINTNLSGNSHGFSADKWPCLILSTTDL